MGSTEVFDCPEKNMGANKKTAMAFSSPRLAGTKMTVSQFTKWLDNLDGNGDGVISKAELEKAIKGMGLWFSSYKTKQAMAAADFNDNGIIDTDEEFKQLIEYAQKHWGLTICED